MNRDHTPRRQTLATLSTVLALAGAGLALPAHADELNWRQTSVLATQDGNTTVRAGVAIVNGKEPATISVRIRPTAPPQGGLMPVMLDMVLRFEDGSTLVTQGESQARLDAQGLPLRGEGRNTGRVVSGTGRFEGMSGTYEMRVRTDIDPLADGVLGDYFATVKATVNRPK